MRLHPLGGDDPRLRRTDVDNAKVAHACYRFGNDDPLGVANDHQTLRINPRHEDRCAVTEDVIVVGFTPRVGEEQAFRVRHPMLLRVVAAEFFAVIKPPA